MTLKEAYIILELTENNNNNIQIIKRQYYKLALKYHPDKILNNSNNPNNSKFQAINEAYQLLLNNQYINTDINETIDIDETTIYTDNTNLLVFNNLASIFIKKYLSINSPEIIFLIKIITEISPHIIENLTKKIEPIILNNIIELLNEYNDIFHIPDIIINILTEQNNNNNLPNTYILNPTFNDILNETVYKLDIGNEEFLLVPLWIPNNTFLNYEEITVKCQMLMDDLPNNIYFDTNNIIHMNLSFHIQELIKIINECSGFIPIFIGIKEILFDISKLYFITEQIIELPNCGIPLHKLINDIPIYSNIFLHIYINFLPEEI